MVAGSIPARVTIHKMKHLLFRILILAPLFSNAETVNSKNFTSAIELKPHKDIVINKIIFVYNASDDFLSVGFDFFHKIISPQTYQCSLCKITYGNISMKNHWKEYIQDLDYDVEFLYKNNFSQYHPNLQLIDVPSAFISDGRSYRQIISKKEFNSLTDLDSLIELMNEKID